MRSILTYLYNAILAILYYTLRKDNEATSEARSEVHQEAPKSLGYLLNRYEGGTNRVPPYCYPLYGNANFWRTELKAPKIT